MITGIQSALASSIPKEVFEALSSTPGEASREWQKYQNKVAEDRLLSEGE